MCWRAGYHSFTSIVQERRGQECERSVGVWKLFLLERGARLCERSVGGEVRWRRHQLRARLRFKR